MAEQWRVEFSTLHVHDADEDGWLSDGDEPYIVSIGFRSRFRTPGSTRAWWSGVLDDKWAEGVDSGQARAIPPNQGVVVFDDVDRPGVAELRGGAMPEVLGVVLVVMESDATPFHVIRVLMNRVKDAIVAQIRPLVEGGAINLVDPQPQIQQAIAAVKSGTELSTREEIALFLVSLGDPDLVVGVKAFVYAALTPIPGLALPVLEEKPIDVDLKQRGVHYQVTGRVRTAPRGWKRLGGGLGADPSIVSWAYGRLDLFVTGTDAALHHGWWQGRWHLWERLARGFVGAPAACSWDANRLDVFARGTNNALLHGWWDGRAWHFWEQLGDGILTSAPDAASWGPGRIDVFARGRDNTLQHMWFDGRWSSWESLGGVLTSGPGVASWGPGRLDVFARGTDNALWHKWFDGRWSDWESLGGQITSDPVAVSWGPGRLDVFARGTGGSCFHRAFDGRWSGWGDLGGRFKGGFGAASQGPGRLDVVGQGMDDACWLLSYGPDGWF